MNKDRDVEIPVCCIYFTDPVKYSEFKALAVELGMSEISWPLLMLEDYLQSYKESASIPVLCDKLSS